MHWRGTDTTDLCVEDSCATAVSAVPSASEPAWEIDLVTVSINDLTILGGVNFDTAGGATTLTVNRLIIDGSSNPVVVTITNTTIRNFTDP